MDLQWTGDTATGRRQTEHTEEEEEDTLNRHDRTSQVIILDVLDSLWVKALKENNKIHPPIATLLNKFKSSAVKW